VLHGETTLPVWSYIVALISGAVVTPFSTLLNARMGDGIATDQLFKMIGGAINPGKPVANLYVGDLINVLLPCPLLLTSAFLPVLHVESRCYIDFNWSDRRP
jgi:hypothetical protein